MVDYSRYSRQINLIGNDGQDSLGKARILCIGVGGLGTLVSSYLVAAGVGNISLIDGDTVELSNLSRQVTYTESNCTNSKVITQAQFLQKLNSSCKVAWYNFFIERHNVTELINQHDLIIDCSDNFNTRYLISDASVFCQKPLISAGIDGFTGQVIILLQDVCYRCVFPKADNKSRACVNGAVIGPAVGIIASIQANEAIKYIINLSRTSQLISLNSLDNKISTFTLSTDPACINNHEDVLLETQVGYMAFDQVRLLDKQNKIQIIDIRTDRKNNWCNLIKINENDLNMFSKLNDQNKYIVVICNYGFKSRLMAYKLASIYNCCIYYSSASKLLYS